MLGLSAGIDDTAIQPEATSCHAPVVDACNPSLRLRCSGTVANTDPSARLHHHPFEDHTPEPPGTLQRSGTRTDLTIVVASAPLCD